MAGWTRRYTSTTRRNALVLAVILAMIAMVVPYGAQVAPTAANAAGDGAVNVPDHPDGTAFNPNQLKDIKAADPGSGVNLISAPGANNLGDARLSYPFELPPGR